VSKLAEYIAAASRSAPGLWGGTDRKASVVGYPHRVADLGSGQTCFDSTGGVRVDYGRYS